MKKFNISKFKKSANTNSNNAANGNKRGKGTPPAKTTNFKATEKVVKEIEANKEAPLYEDVASFVDQVTAPALQYPKGDIEEAQINLEMLKEEMETKSYNRAAAGLAGKCKSRLNSAINKLQKDIRTMIKAQEDAAAAASKVPDVAPEVVADAKVVTAPPANVAKVTPPATKDPKIQTSKKQNQNQAPANNDITIPSDKFWVEGMIMGCIGDSVFVKLEREAKPAMVDLDGVHPSLKKNFVQGAMVSGLLHKFKGGSTLYSPKIESPAAFSTVGLAKSIPTFEVVSEGDIIGKFYKNAKTVCPSKTDIGKVFGSNLRFRVVIDGEVFYVTDKVDAKATAQVEAATA